jgi:hypothetical protein
VSGVFLIEGGLYRQGEETCVAVHIECIRKTNQCEMIEVSILKLPILPYPEIGPIKLYDPIRIVEWTRESLIAEGNTTSCQSTQLTVDFGQHKAHLIETPRCPPGASAPIVKEVRTFRTNPSRTD